MMILGPHTQTNPPAFTQSPWDRVILHCNYGSLSVSILVLVKSATEQECTQGLG